MCIFPAFLLFYLFSTPIYVLRLIINWKRFSKWKRTLIIIQNAAITYFLICLFTLSGLWLPGYIPFGYGFRDRAKATIDIYGIQNWLKTVDPNLCENKMYRKNEWPKDINYPVAVATRNPVYLSLSLDENNTPKIRLAWGGGMAHWGVEIGSEKMKIPPTKERRIEEYTNTLNGKKESLWHSGEFRLPIAPGAYAWQEIQ